MWVVMCKRIIFGPFASASDAGVFLEANHIYLAEPVILKMSDPSEFRVSSRPAGEPITALLNN